MENKEFTVSRDDMRRALDAFGIEKDAIILTHSSLKSCGTIQGGAEGVIEAISDTIPEGTVVFPTLAKSNWGTVYRDWHMDRPSEVGFISETFRKQKGSLRSNSPTHSVAARGRNAADLVSGPDNEGPRIGIFGSYPFGHYSSWQKMYESRKRYGVRSYMLFWGVNMNYLTLKHLIEYMYTEEMLARVKDPELLADLMQDLAQYPVPEGKIFFTVHWPFYSSESVYQKILLPEGIAKRVPLGKNELRITDTYETVERTLALLREDPYRWVTPYTHPWLDRLFRAIGK